MRRALALVGVIAMVGVALGIMGLLRPAADASEHSAIRSFSADKVVEGDELTVRITVAGNWALLGQSWKPFPKASTMYPALSLG